MVTNYYNSSNNFSSPVRTEPEPHSEKKDKIPICPVPKTQGDNFDKLLLLGLLFALYMTGCKDDILLLALLFLLIY